MKAPLFFSLLLLLGSGGVAWSQFVPKSKEAAPPATQTAAGTPAPASAAPATTTTAPTPAATPPVTDPGLPPGVKIMRAIPVEMPMVVNTDLLPRTLPEDAHIVYSQCKVEGNVIAITFDDGPHPQNTPRLLDMLKERNIKATFFLIGKSVATYPDVVKRIVAEGHEVANHSWSHPNLAPMKETRIMDQLQTTHDAIVSACGVAPIMYRPPYGSIRMTQRKTIHDRFGYPTILWDVDPNDWQSPRTVKKVHDRVLAQTKPGSIILCHDIHQPTVDAMPAVLDELKARGYQFVTVSQLINLDSQTALKHAAIAAKAAEEAAKAAAAAAPPPSATPATTPTPPVTVAPAIIPSNNATAPTSAPATPPAQDKPAIAPATSTTPPQPPVTR